MKSNGSLLCIVFALCLVLNLLIPNINGVAVPGDLSDDFAESYNYIFIGTVVNKTVQANQTLYLFNVTENLKQPLNTTQITITSMGGSDIAVSPSISFYTGLDYLVFFDELDEENKVIGFDYYATLLSMIADERLQTIREEADKSRAIAIALSMFHSELPLISNPLNNVSNINVTKVMKYQIEKPEGSGNFTDVWRVDVRGEGFEEDGDHVWRAIMFHIDLDTGEVSVGPIVGSDITDVSDFAQDNAIGNQARDAASDYNSIQHLIFNVALLITAVIFIIIYIRSIRK